MERKRTILTLVLLFAAVYYIARIAIFVAGATGNMEFEEKQSALVEDFVLVSFLAIGVAGLLLLSGILLNKPWGFWGTMGVSAYTIAFDLWAFIAIQPSAGAGVVPAAVIAAMLVLLRGGPISQTSV